MKVNLVSFNNICLILQMRNFLIEFCSVSSLCFAYVSLTLYYSYLYTHFLFIFKCSLLYNFMFQTKIVIINF